MMLSVLTILDHYLQTVDIQDIKQLLLILLQSHNVCAMDLDVLSNDLHAFLVYSVQQQLTIHRYYYQLTAREIQVLELIAGGLAYSDCASRLNISERTIRKHIDSIAVKLNIYDLYGRSSIARKIVAHVYQPSQWGVDNDTYETT